MLSCVYKTVYTFVVIELKKILRTILSIADVECVYDISDKYRGKNTV